MNCSFLRRSYQNFILIVNILIGFDFFYEGLEKAFALLVRERVGIGEGYLCAFGEDEIEVQLCIVLFDLR